MRNIYNALLLLIAGATQKELARQVTYLKVENKILRSKLGARVSVTAAEKSRLVRFGQKLGRGLNELVSIVHPDTLRRWIRETRKPNRKSPRRVGRRRTAEDIRKLILMMARQTGWGYTRIVGELRKLNIRSVSRNTVKNILRKAGFDPGPKRGIGTWDEFLKIHAATLWQCDLMSLKALTPKGFRDLFLLVFLHAESRRVFLTPATYHPNEAWVCEQAKAFVKHARRVKLPIDIVMHDRDSKFSAWVDDEFRAAGIRVQKTAYRSPNTVAYVERFIQTIQQELLDHFFVFGERHLNHLCAVFLDYYHRLRPHQAKDNELLVAKRRSKPPPTEVIPLSEVRCEQRLGGLLKHYYRKAA